MSERPLACWGVLREIRQGYPFLGSHISAVRRHTPKTSAQEYHSE